MATTITIDDEIFEQLKLRAAREATTVNSLIEESLRVATRAGENHSSPQQFELVTFGEGGRFTTFDINQISTLIEQDDVAAYGHRR
jgi:hypothetical protein